MAQGAVRIPMKSYLEVERQMAPAVVIQRRNECWAAVHDVQCAVCCAV